MRKVELLPTRDCEAGYGPDSVSKVTRPPDQSLVEYASSAGRVQNVVIIHLDKHT